MALITLLGPVTHCNSRVQINAYALPILVQDTLNA